MASFASVGANAFLNSEHAVNIAGPNPHTERGSGTVLNFHPKEPRVIYPSGKFIVVKSLIDPNDCFVYRGHSQPTTVAKFSPNGYWVASADTSGKVRVWSWDNPEHLTKLESQVLGSAVLDLDWDFESKKIVAAGDGTGIIAKCFTWDTGNSAGEMVGHSKRILSVAFKPNRPFRIMTGSEDMRTVFYQGPPFKMDHSNPTHTNFVNCVRFSPDGQHVVSVGSDKKIQFYAGADGQPNGEILNAHTGTIFTACFSPDSTRLATASADKTVKIWNVASKTLETTINISANPQVGDMQVSLGWNKDYLLSLSLNGDINILDVNQTTGPIRVIQGHQVAITSMCLDRANGILYTGSYDGVVVSRNLSTGATFKVKGADIRNVCGAAHSNRISGITLVGDELISVGWDDHIRQASVSANQYTGGSALNGQPVSIASDAASGLVAVITNHEIALFQGQTKVGALGSLGYTPTSIAMLESNELAVGADNNKINIYSIDNNNLTLRHTIDTRSVPTALAYSPSGQHLAAGDSARVVEVYNHGTWTPIINGKWVFHTSKITCLSWSPNGKYLASGSLDENIFIWDFENPMQKTQFAFTHAGGVSGVAWVDGNRLVSVGNDHCVVNWKVKSLVA